MKYRAARKVGWIWTRAGWKRVPFRLRRVKKVPMPSKHRTRKLFIVKPAEPKAKKAAPVEAPKIAAEQGRSVFAPHVAPKPENFAVRQIRRVWGGKYDELTSAPTSRLHPPRLQGAGGMAMTPKEPATHPDDAREVLTRALAALVAAGVALEDAPTRQKLAPRGPEWAEGFELASVRLEAFALGASHPAAFLASSRMGQEKRHGERPRRFCVGARLRRGRAARGGGLSARPAGMEREITTNSLRTRRGHEHQRHDRRRMGVL